MTHIAVLDLVVLGFLNDAMDFVDSAVNLRAGTVNVNDVRTVLTEFNGDTLILADNPMPIVKHMS
jgi:hypothetical protein